MKPPSSIFTALSRSFVSTSKSFTPSPNPVVQLKNSNNIPSTILKRSQPNIDKVIEDNILGVGTTPQNIKPGKPNALSGKVVTFSNPWKSEILDSKDFNSFYSAILSCGLGGGGSEHSLYESYFPISQLLEDENIAVYSSITDSERRPERFRKGLPYYYDESYINEEESENFFNQILKRRFFDDNDKLKNPKWITNLVLFGFSIGHRENISHINYLHKRINESLIREGKNENLVQNYFDKIALVNIGSPVNWEERKLPKEILDGLEQGTISAKEAEEHYAKHGSIKTENKSLPQFNIVNYRSVFDMGTAKPKSDFNNFHCNKDLFRPAIYSFIRPNRKDYMYLFGPELMREIYFNDETNEPPKNNMLGHNLANYAHAIYENMYTSHPITALRSSAKSDLRSAAGVMAAPYQKDRIPSAEDVAVMRRDWSREMINRNGKNFAYQAIKQFESEQTR